MPICNIDAHLINWHTEQRHTGDPAPNFQVLGLNSPSKSIILSLSIYLSVHRHPATHLPWVLFHRCNLVEGPAYHHPPASNIHQTHNQVIIHPNIPQLDTHARTSDTTLTPATNEGTNERTTKSISIITMRTTKQDIIPNLGEENQSLVVRTSGGAAITVILAGTLIIPLSLHFLNAPTNRCAIHAATVRHNTPTTPSTTKP